jgi:hypothetical protein
MKPIPQLIAVTIAATLAGCTSVWNCNPDEEQFVVDGTLTEEDVTVMVERWGLTDSSALECEEVCQYVYEETTGWVTNTMTTCEMSLTDAGGTVQCEGDGFEGYCEGRRPLGHQEAAECADDLGGYLARCAHLERASVVAFDQLSDWLAERGAPEALIARCRLAARQERDHARVIGDLAAHHGGERLAVEQEDVPADLLTVALHNATEGCVQEVWAALLAQWKAEHAQDTALRSAYARIAADEAAHGQLAWDLHGWLMARLSEVERVQVMDAQRHALGRLPELARRQVARFPAVLGLPAPVLAAELAAGLGLRLAA